MQPPAGHTLVKWGILEAFGIFAISVSGHTSLPVLRNSMKNPKACCTALQVAEMTAPLQTSEHSMLANSENLPACMRVPLPYALVCADATQPHGACFAAPPAWQLRRG